MLKIQQSSINNKKSSRNVTDSLWLQWLIQYRKIEFHVAEQARLINVKPRRASYAIHFDKRAMFKGKSFRKLPSR